MDCCSATATGSRLSVTSDPIIMCFVMSEDSGECSLHVLSPACHLKGCRLMHKSCVMTYHAYHVLEVEATLEEWTALPLA